MLRAWRIGFTAIATLWAGNSVLAQVELVEPLPFEVSGQVSGQFSDDIAQCECSESSPGKIRSGVLCRKHNGKVCGIVSGVKQNVAMLSHRESPTGNMSLHFPYRATQMYYYRRPYNYQHVPTHLQESEMSAARSLIGNNLGYSNQIFDQAHESVEAYLNTEGLQIDKDGLLEYVDWKDHQQDRLAWEAKPGYEVEQRVEQRVEQLVPSVPASDEQLLNSTSSTEKSNQPQDLPESEDRVMLIQLQDGFSAFQRERSDVPTESP